MPLLGSASLTSGPLQEAQSDATPQDGREAGRTSLIGPVADFLLLGGSSLLILPMLLLLPVESSRTGVAATMLVLANFINHPHFAHSYQIFYRNFRQKIGDSSNYGRTLRLRFLAVGIIVPLSLIAFFSIAIVTDKPALLALAVNAMGFLVGWHYVKQGYGMLMVNCALRKRFFSGTEKSLLRINAYCCWILSWLTANSEFREHDYWGLSYFTFNAPEWCQLLAAAAAIALTVLTALMVVAKMLSWRGTTPINGLVAYAVTIYLWVVLVSVNPLFLLVVPALHSIQYLTVVWRYQFNAEVAQSVEMSRAQSMAPRIVNLKFALFLAIGYAGGYYAFHLMPAFLDTHVAYAPIFGQTLFMFLFWIFINIHHYFIDNVIWRADNPDTKRFLFAAR